MINIADAVDEMKKRDDFDWSSDDRWSEAEVDKFERCLIYSRIKGEDPGSLRLPSQLRDFLLNVGMCSAEYFSCFLVKSPNDRVAINDIQVVGSKNPDQLLSYSTNFLSYYYGENRDKLMPGRVPNGYIFMGTAEGGHAYLLMDGTNPENNAVYIWGLAYDPWGEGDNTLGIGKCGDTLAEFLYNLQPRENL